MVVALRWDVVGQFGNLAIFFSVAIGGTLKTTFETRHFK